MFPAVCHQFANAMGRHTLIPSSSLDESTKIVPFNVVVKQIKRKWIFFHKEVYSAYAFPLYDLLEDKSVFETKLEVNKFCSYNPESTYSLSGKFGAKILEDLMDATLCASDNVTISAKLGEIELCQVSNQDDFMTELMSRKLNLDHPLIQQIRKDDRNVLCVIRGVVSTSGSAEIKRTDNEKEEVHIEEKWKAESGSISEDGSENKTKDIVLEKGTALAYKVWELKIDPVTRKIVPMVTNGSTGGFTRSTMDATDGGSTEDSGSSDQYDTLLQPIHELTETDKQQLQASLLKLMTCHSDVHVLAKLIEDAEQGQLNEDTESVKKQLVNKDTVMDILAVCGVDTQGKSLKLNGEASPLLKAVGDVVDAMTEMESQDLEKINQCSPQQRTALSRVLQSSINSKMPITAEPDMMSALGTPVDSLLTAMGYTICKDDGTILPPNTSTKDIECLYYITGCLI